MKLFFTFGDRTPYRHNYVEIWAPDAEKAREMMFEAHDQYWGFQYTEQEFEGQIDRKGLTRLSWLKIKNGLTICELPSYTLTPSDILDLRASVRWPLTATRAALVPHPCIIYCREEPMTMNAPGYDPDAFALYVGGCLWAISARPEVLAACLRAEYAEPGFMARIKNPAEDCETAILNPDARAAEQRRRAFEAKAAREYAEERAREAQRGQERERPRPADPEIAMPWPRTQREDIEATYKWLRIINRLAVVIVLLIVACIIWWR